MSDFLERAESQRDDVTRFLRELIAIPSPSGGEAEVANRVVEEMERLGYDEVSTDAMGNAVGRIGKGDVKIVLDAHMDTVGVGDASAWPHDPYQGVHEDDIVFGRGASDNKGALAAQVYAGRLIKESAADVTVYVVGSVMEEDCDGLALGHFLIETVPGVDAVVLGECTNLAVYRGHRGRMEMSATTKGRSSHASAPERGDNAVTAIAPLVLEVSELNERLADDPFLGKGTIAVTKIECQTASLNAIPDAATIYLDRRLTAGESLESALKEVRSLRSAATATVEVLKYAEPAYTGLVRETDKYYPTWALDEDHPLVAAGVSASENALGVTPPIGKWTFSTNGVSSAGRLGIPTIGLGPSEERWAHTVLDQCPVDHLVKAMAFYAALPEAVITKGIAT